MLSRCALNQFLSVTPIAINHIAGAPISSVSIATINNDVDPNNGSDYTVVIKWGDGTPTSTGTITGSGTTPTVTGSHTYSTPNTSTVTITISNNQGNTTPVNITETVTGRPGHLRRGSRHPFVRLGEHGSYSSCSPKWRVRTSDANWCASSATLR
jgi:hypothetical protein